MTERFVTRGFVSWRSSIGPGSVAERTTYVDARGAAYLRFERR